VIDDLLKDARDRMTKSVEATRNEFATVRTGRASPHLLDRLDIDYYGTRTPLRQLSSIAAPEGRLLTVTPYDKSAIKAIEKAIMESDLGLTPNSDGTMIRLQIPELTEERRKELVKVAHKYAEQQRIAVRNVRRDANDDLRAAEKAHVIAQDEEKRMETEVQKLTDEAIKRVDEALKTKEQEIMHV